MPRTRIVGGSNIVLFVGCSGAGKGSIVEEIKARDRWFKSPRSFTTRSPRASDEGKNQYIFTTVAEFERAKANKELVEWASINGNFYGLSLVEFEEIRRMHYDIIRDVDCVGACNVCTHFPWTVTIAVLPGSISELLVRMKKNSKDQADLEERWSRVPMELEVATSFDTAIINRDGCLEAAVCRAREIIHRARVYDKEELHEFREDHHVDMLLGQLAAQTL